MRVTVLMGGTSEEREVSLASGVQVGAALREAGHEVRAVDTARGILTREEETRIREAGVGDEPPDPDDVGLLGRGDVTALARELRKAGGEVIFVTLHGGSGEDGTIQAFLDLMELPYAGSGRLGCTLAMDKDVSKRLFRDAGIPTADWLTGDPEAEEVAERLGLPVIVKPAAGGSTLGLSLVRREEEFEEAVRKAARYGRPVLYEAYVEGREFTVGVVGGEALPVGEIVPAHELFDYACKYQPGMAEEIFPAEIPGELAEELRTLALRAHRLLRLRDFSRVDFLVDPDRRPWCLEANPLPGMTGTSLLPRAAAAAGVDFPGLCHRIMVLARERADR